MPQPGQLISPGGAAPVLSAAGEETLLSPSWANPRTLAGEIREIGATQDHSGVDMSDKKTRRASRLRQPQPSDSQHVNSDRRIGPETAPGHI
jgi:hypothetical protein